LQTPSRWTLLHQFIKDRFLEHRVLGFEDHRNDMLDLVAFEYQKILDGYNINYVFQEIDPDLHDYEDKILDQIEELRRLLPLSQIAHETFQLLFSDRGFLKVFNQLIAGFIKDFKKNDFPEIFKRDGVLHRKSLPVWAKRGVFYRDRGRCIGCSKDMTGVVVTGEEIHYDHMVPLADGGTNDPMNFQILCRECNLRKGIKTFTSELYPTYWSL
jgi:HNH endonuclease